MNAKRTTRRGVTSLLAMLYLVLFSTLAVGFYAATTTQSQISSNDAGALEAGLAAETGMDFVRHHLALVVVPPLTSEDELLGEVCEDLAAMMNPMDNLRPNSVALDETGTVIEIPSGAGNYIRMWDKGPRFRATITRDGTQLIVKCIGLSGGANAAGASSGPAAGVKLTFEAEQLTDNFFDYGMASKGPVVIESQNVVNGVPASQASVLCTLDQVNPVTIGSGNALNPGGIIGDITVVDGREPLIRPGASVEGSNNPLTIASNSVNHIAPSEAPAFPVIDTAVFEQYATNPYVPGRILYENIRIPRGTNPTFNGPMTVRGVVYVEQPNIVSFNGNVTMQAVIATQDVNAGTLGNCIIQLAGNGGAKLPLSDLPIEPQFAEVRNLTGSFIVAPGFQVTMAGNFGTINGHVVADSVAISGNATATIRGSLVALEPQRLSIGGNTRITFAEQAELGFAGLRFKERFKPKPSTYREIRP